MARNNNKNILQIGFAHLNKGAPVLQKALDIFVLF